MGVSRKNEQTTRRRRNIFQSGTDRKKRRAKGEGSELVDSRGEEEVGGISCATKWTRTKVGENRRSKSLAAGVNIL